MERLIWRIENENENGPYGQCYFGPSHNDMDTHPSPYKDLAADPEHPDALPPYLAINHYEKCGSASLRELREWFEGHGKRLADKDFKVVALAVDDVHVRLGQRQLVFNRDKARVIHRMNPEHFITSTSKIKED